MTATIRTFTGNVLDVIEPRAQDIHLLDVAHALASQHRFNGHTRRPSSVARHSIVVADLVASRTNNPNTIRAALFHDASEAFIGDMVHPLKKEVPQFREVEDVLEAVIAERFGFTTSPEEHALIKAADWTCLHWEQRDLVNRPSPNHPIIDVPHGAPLVIPWESYPECDLAVDRMEFLVYVHSMGLHKDALDAMQELERLTAASWTR